VTARNSNSKVPEINLFVRQQAPRPDTGRRRYVEGTLIAVVIVIWGAVGAFIATLFGWHPNLGP
jgi:hypothetical protein